jgi:hypothetical protein
MLIHFKPLAVAVISIIVFLGTRQALGNTQSVTASITFAAPMTLTKNADINFGTVTAGAPGTYTITPAGVLSASEPGANLRSTTSAGSITIAGSATQLINISEGSHTADGGVTLANVKCAYNGGASGSCTIIGAAAPGAGRTLLLGADVVVNGTQATGSTVAPTLTVAVVYQ